MVLIWAKCPFMLLLSVLQVKTIDCCDHISRVTLSLSPVINVCVETTHSTVSQKAWKWKPTNRLMCLHPPYEVSLLLPPSVTRANSKRLKGEVHPQRWEKQVDFGKHTCQNDVFIICMTRGDTTWIVTVPMVQHSFGENSREKCQTVQLR